MVDRPFVTRASGPAGMAVDQGPSWLNTSRGAIAGIAWDDQQTVRVAWHEMPEEGVHWQADLVQVATVTVP